jgi:hypothetical protein
MNRRIDGKTVDPGKSGGVNFMGSVCGDAGSPSGTVTHIRVLAGVLAATIPYRSGTSHVALPRTHHEEAASHHEPRRRSQVNRQPPRKEAQAEFFSGHVAPASHAHEQVTSTKTANQGTKEPASHTTGQQ